MIKNDIKSQQTIDTPHAVKQRRQEYYFGEDYGYDDNVYRRRSDNNNSEKYKQKNRKNQYNPNQNSFSIHLRQRAQDNHKFQLLRNKNANLSISHQGNQTNTLNLSKSKSFSRQQQNSKHFYSSNNPKITNNNNKHQINLLNFNKKQHSSSKQNYTSSGTTFQNNYFYKKLQPKSKQSKSISKSITKSLSKKTQNIKFHKSNVYLQQIKSRKILNQSKSQQNLILKAQKDDCFQPKFNVQLCERYMEINNQNDRKQFLQKQEPQESKHFLEMIFNKNSKFDKNHKKKLNQSQYKNPYRTVNDYAYGKNSKSSQNYLPINTKTLLMSKKYNFTLKNANRYTQPPQNNLNLKQSKVYNYLDYSRSSNINIPRSNMLSSSSQLNIVPYRIREDDQTRWKSVSVKKTQTKRFKQRKDQLKSQFQPQRISFVKKDSHNNFTSKFFPNNNQFGQQYQKVDGIPSYILIQQQDIRSSSFSSNPNLTNQVPNDYGFSQNLKSYYIKRLTKLFICKYCLQIFNTFQLKHHKGIVCKIVFKQQEYHKKLLKLIRFLQQIYEKHYEKQEFYECFNKLKIKLEQIQLILYRDQNNFEQQLLQHATYESQHQFITQQKASPTINNHIKRVKLYSSNQLLSNSQFLNKIQQILKLNQIQELKQIFISVYKIVDLNLLNLKNSQNQNGNYQNSNKVFKSKQKIIVVNDLFWLVNKIIEGLVIQKVNKLSNRLVLF